MSGDDIGLHISEFADYYIAECAELKVLPMALVTTSTSRPNARLTRPFTSFQPHHLAYL